MTALGQGALGAAQAITGALAGLPLLTAVILTDAATADSRSPVSVACEQAGPILWRPPSPRYSTIDRPGTIGALEYDGQNPYECHIPVRLDGFPSRSVEAEITVLEGFAEVQGGRSEPATVIVSGAVPLPHPNLEWRVTAIDDPSDLLFLPGGTQRCRYSTTVTLTQRATNADASKSIRQNSGSKVVNVRTTTVRSTEHTLMDVARRYYRDASRATDIARANLIQLGDRLHQGQKLRMPQ